MRYNRIFLWRRNFSTPLSYLTPRCYAPIPKDICSMFGVRKLESLSYNPVLIAWWSDLFFPHNTPVWQTDGQTPYNSVYRAMHMRRAVKTTFSHSRDSHLVHAKSLVALRTPDARANVSPYKWSDATAVAPCIIKYNLSLVATDVWLFFLWQRRQHNSQPVGIVASTGDDDGDCLAAGCEEICLRSTAPSVTCTCPSDNTRVLAADRQFCLGASLIISTHYLIISSSTVVWFSVGLFHF